MTTVTPFTGGEARRAARNAAAIAVARLLSSGALFGWQILLGRLLGEGEFGIYGTIGGLFSIGASFAAFSMSLIAIREVARHPERAGDILATTLFYTTIFALLAYIGVNIAGWGLGYSPELRALTAVATLSLFVDTVGSLAYDQLLAHERMVTAAVAEVGHILIRIGLAAGALALGFGLAGVYTVTILASIGRGAVLWTALRRVGVRPHFPLDRAIARGILVNSLPLMIASVINITYTQIDKLMSTQILTEADTGHLNAAFVIIVGVVEILSTTILIALYPMMARAVTDTEAMFRFIVEKLAFFTLLIGIPLGIGFTLFGDKVTALFGAKFAPSGDILRVLIWYAVTTMIVNVFAQAMMAQNDQRRYVVVRAGGLALKLSLNLILLPTIGVIGAAFASVAAEIIVLIFVARAAVPQGAAVLMRRAPQLLLLAAFTAGAMALGGLVHFIIGALVGVGVYGAGLLALRILTPEDWDLLYRLAAAIPGGGLIRRVWKRETIIHF